MGTGTSRRLPSTLTAVAVVVAIAGLVAIVARSASPWTSPRVMPVSRTEVLATIAVVFSLGIAAAAVLALVVHRAFIARRPGAPSLRATLLRALPATTAALVALSLLAIAGSNRVRGEADGTGTGRYFERSERSGSLWGFTDRRGSPVRAGPGAEEPEVSAGAGSTTGTGLLPALAVIVVLAAALAVVIARRRQPRGRSVDEPPEAGRSGPTAADREAAREAVRATIDAMLADLDPNTAIIGAYARLLEGLGARGIGRMDHEAPFEHLRRVLSSLDVRPDPLRTLIELFEVARFSTHPLDASHREQALDALRATAADLGLGAAHAGAATGRPATGAGQ